MYTGHGLPIPKCVFTLYISSCEFSNSYLLVMECSFYGNHFMCNFEPKQCLVNNNFTMDNRIHDAQLD